MVWGAGHRRVGGGEDEPMVKSVWSNAMPTFLRVEGVNTVSGPTEMMLRPGFRIWLAFGEICRGTTLEIKSFRAFFTYCL